MVKSLKLANVSTNVFVPLQKNNINNHELSLLLYDIFGR